MPLEGGPLKCSLLPECKDFETWDIEEWNQHHQDGRHYDITSTLCISCGNRINAQIPYKDLDQGGSKNISMKCKTCDPESDYIDLDVDAAAMQAETQAEAGIESKPTKARRKST